MIQIEYLLTALRVDVIESKHFTEEQKKELYGLLDTCPTIPMSINPARLIKASEVVIAHLNVYEHKYLAFGGKQSNLEAIRDDYKRTIVSALKGFQRGKMI